MPEERNYALAEYRLERAVECLTDAKTLLSLESYNSSANRSYYCIFHAMRAVLALDGLDFKKHSGVITFFRQQYIKTGIFSTDLSKIIDLAFKVRSQSDYDDFYILSKEDVAEQVQNAELFLTSIRTYLADLIK